MESRKQVFQLKYHLHQHLWLYVLQTVEPHLWNEYIQMWSLVFGYQLEPWRSLIALQLPEPLVCNEWHNHIHHLPLHSHLHPYHSKQYYLACSYVGSFHCHQRSSYDDQMEFLPTVDFYVPYRLLRRQLHEGFQCFEERPSCIQRGLYSHLHLVKWQCEHFRFHPLEEHEFLLHFLQYQGL